MIKFIIGENASGKTLYLDNCIQDELNSSEQVNFVTNLYTVNDTDVRYNARKLEILEDISNSERVDTSNQTLYIVGSPVKLSNEFLNLIDLLCKDCKKAFIDEPEQGMSEYEINLLGSFLEVVDKEFDEIIIVTHSELLIQIPRCEIYTVKMRDTSNEVGLIKVEDGDKFEIIDK